LGSLFAIDGFAHRDRFEHLGAQNFSFRSGSAANRRLLALADDGRRLAGIRRMWHFSWGDQMWAALTDTKSAALRIGGYSRTGPEGASQSMPPAAECRPLNRPVHIQGPA